MWRWIPLYLWDKVSRTVFNLSFFFFIFFFFLFFFFFFSSSSFSSSYFLVLLFVLLLFIQIRLLLRLLLFLLLHHLLLLFLLRRRRLIHILVLFVYARASSFIHLSVYICNYKFKSMTGTEIHTSSNQTYTTKWVTKSLLRFGGEHDSLEST